MTNQMNVKEAERRAQTRAVSQELKIMEQEQARAEEQERKNELACRERDANIEHMIVNDLAKLKPLYEKRQAAFEALNTALTEFMEVEQQIMPVLNKARHSIPNQSSMYPGHLRQKWVTLASRAGITTEHSMLSGGTPLSRTVVFSLVNGYIVPGQISTVGGVLNVVIE